MTNLAVILAARKERMSDVPFPLLPFEGDMCLIDRTLGLLKEIGIKHILLVVGFRKELFGKYVDDIVQLVYADHYEFSSSMASLAAAKEHINEDFILVEGDTFFEKKVLEQISKIDNGNCLVATEESGSGDECYIESQSGFITKISKDKHRVSRFEGELLGISRISYETYCKMLSLWYSSANSYLNYEYVLMDVTSVLERPFLFFKNLIWGDVDCIEDFKRLKEITSKTLRRKEDPFDMDNLLKCLSDIFPEQDVSTSKITRIGGMSNKNFRVDFNGKSYVLRIPGPGSDGMVERTNEEFNAMLGCQMGVNPEIRYFNTKTGVKLADFVDNAETLNSATVQRHDNLKKIAEIYHRVHDARVRMKNEFNIFREIEKYNRLIESVGATMYDGWVSFKPKVMDLEWRLNSIGIEMNPCHNDAVPENFIKAQDGTIYLIDWEYSGMNDPMADFAALFLESEFTEEKKEFFLNEYYKGEVPSGIEERILCYEIMWDTLWSLWTVLKEAYGEDFGSYGLDRFNRAMTYYCRLNIHYDENKRIAKD